MSFILENLARASVSFNSDAPDSFNYFHPTDTIADISASNYFFAQQRSFSINTIILVLASDGVVFLKVTAVEPAVTTEIIVQNLGINANPVFNSLQLANLNGGGHLTLSVTPFGQEPQLVDIPDLIAFVDVVTRMGLGTATPDPSASLDMVSTVSGFLPPRMTTAQRDAIAAAAEGLIIFNTSTDTLDVRAGGVWKTIATV